jgi:nucleoporin p58/p45
LNNQPTTGLGGGLGQSTNQQPVPGVRIDISNLRGTTRFNDLQEDLQKVIINFDQQIQSWISQKNELDAFMPAHGEMLSNIPNDVKFIQTKYDGVQTALRSDAEAIEQVQTLIQQDADHARLSFRAVDNLKLPQQYHTTGLWSSRSPQGGSANNETDGQDIVNFFSKTADEMDEQLKRYEKNLTEIELHMHGIQGNLVEQLQRMMATKNGGASPADEKLAELGAVLRDFEQSILEVAQQVGASREGMTRLQLGDFITNTQSRSGVY